MDPQTVHGVVDPHRVNELEVSQKEDRRTREKQPGTSNTYLIEAPTRDFLNVDVLFALKKPAENKVWVSWENRFDMPDCDIICCPKLDSIVENVLKKEAVDEDSQWSLLQNLMLDAIHPLVVVFEELSSEEPDVDRMSTAIQQALLFLGNTRAHFSQLRRAKILKKLNPDVQSLAKNADFSKAAPYLFG